MSNVFRFSALLIVMGLLITSNVGCARKKNVNKVASLEAQMGVVTDELVRLDQQIQEIRASINSWCRPSGPVPISDSPDEAAHIHFSRISGTSIRQQEQAIIRIAANGSCWPLRAVCTHLGQPEPSLLQPAPVCGPWCCCSGRRLCESRVGQSQRQVQRPVHRK